MIAQQTVGWASLNGGTTGGQGGKTVYVSTQAEFLKYIGSQEPYIIMITDTIDLELYKQEIVWGNKSLIGVGTKGAIRYGGLAIRGDNVILQNLSIIDSYDGDWEGKTHGTDAIVIYAKNVWIDHCHLSAAADGLLDITSRPESVSDFVTVSWTRFSNHSKVMLIGSWDESPRDRGHLNTTIYNCWFDGTIERGLNNRMPQVRFGKVHVFNNYYENVAHYCASSRVEAKVYLEKNYFRGCSDPHTIGEREIGIAPPELVAVDNTYEISDDTRTVEGKAFSPEQYYNYPVIEPEEVPATVMNGAGLFNPVNNTNPEAINDQVIINTQKASLQIIDVLSNDHDKDGDDLRIARITKKPRGIAYVYNNKIEYKADFSPLTKDQLTYQMVDTKGGIATGEVYISFTQNTLDAISTGYSYPSESGSQDLNFDILGDRVLINYPSLSSYEKIQITFLDLAGKKHHPIIERQFTNGNMKCLEIRTSGFVPGIYQFIIRKGTEKLLGKLVISGRD